MTKQEEEPSLATVIGKGYAYVQHGMDKVIAWGFAKMNEAGEMPEEKKKNADDAASRLKHAGKGVLKFFGTMGRTYYDTYEELKRKR